MVEFDRLAFQVRLETGKITVQQVPRDQPWEVVLEIIHQVWRIEGGGYQHLPAGIVVIPTKGMDFMEIVSK